jgi:NDP-mannose synthase
MSTEAFTKAVILAGGLGLRLRPLTNLIPKPLLPIGESTILEVQLLCLKKFGVSEVYIAANYMADYLEAIIQDGGKYGLKIHVSREEQPLGTCGPLSLLRDELSAPFFMMNGDILTNIDFGKLGAFSHRTKADLTVVTKEINIPFRFGRVLSKGDYISEIEEKPTYKQEVLAGIYALTPGVFDFIPEATAYGVDELIKDMMTRNRPVAKYLTHDYWIDVGQLDDYEIAKQDVGARRLVIPKSA